MAGEKTRMQLSADDSITVVTDMFEHRNAKPHFINPCCFGEDFAEWLKQELSRFRDDPGGLWLGFLGGAWRRSLLDRRFLRWGWASGGASPMGHLGQSQSRT